MRHGLLKAETINMSHGSGGRAMRQLIESIFVPAFANSDFSLEDQAAIELSRLAALGDRIAMTTDSFVVDPIFFPGGDIGSLAVNGTVNDLAVGGAKPLFLSCGFILEEGFEIAQLRRIVESIKNAAKAAEVRIITGDTKVVGRGAADKIFINTSGFGVVPSNITISSSAAKAGDAIIINGPIGDHGAAIIGARSDLALENHIRSDSQPLARLVGAMLDVCPEIHCLRDATRGGLATVLNEFADASQVAMHVDESAIAVSPEVRAVSEILGLDPLYLANEGKLVAVVPSRYADALVRRMRSFEEGSLSAVIGEVGREPAGTVVLRTNIGGTRLVDMLLGDQLPRIC